MAASGLRSVLAASPLPQRIGPYEIVSSLGVGGMARVYLGLRRGPGTARKLLAIKQVRAEIAADENFLAMFVDEARIALRLSHPNVVSTFDVVAEPGEFFMALEYLEGQSLAEVLRRVGREHVPREVHVWILTQVLAGLDYAHKLTDFDGTSLGIVHRDVSPSNVFVTYTGQVKLVDFGIAKAIGGLAETQQGMIKGKLGYVAPEQCLGKPVDARSDVYSVGVMLWEALALRRRAVGETPMATLQARVQDTEERIDEVWPEVPEELAQITQRALAADPAERFASALELQRALEGYLQRHGRRIGQANLAALMGECFDSDLRAQRLAVEEHLGTVRPIDAAPHTLPISQKIPLAEVEPRSFTATGAASTLLARSKGDSVGLRRIVVVAIVALVSVGAFAVLLGRNRGLEGARAAPKPSAAVAASTPEPIQPSGVATTPSSSEAKSADGVAPEAHTAAPRQPRAAAVVAARRLPAAGPVAPHSVASGPEPRALEPGSDLGASAAPRSNGSHGIDEKDPYSK